MSETSFTGFFNNSQMFGMNIKTRDQALKQVVKTTENVAGGVLEPLLNYLATNENVFSGDIETELNRIRSNTFNTAYIMNVADEKVNGPKPTFDATF